MRSFATLAPAVVVVAALAAAGPGVAQAQSVVLDDGHHDYAARLVDGQLRSQIKDGRTSPAVYRPPADVVVALSAAARVTVPAKPPAAGLGAPGSRVWIIPQVQAPGVPWLGWNTEALTAAEISGPVRWSLNAVSGPGAVTVFQSGAFGAADVLFDSSDGLPDSRDVPLGVHAHGNWTFSAAGRYALTFTMRATGADGRALSDTQTLAVAVEAPAAPGAPVAPTVPSSPGQGNVDPAPIPGGSPAAGGENSRPPQNVSGSTDSSTLRLRSAQARGRSLTVGLKVPAASRVKVKVRRGSRTVASAKAVTVRPSSKRARLRLSRPLSRGVFTVQVTATPKKRSHGPVQVATIKLKVR